MNAQKPQLTVGITTHNRPAAIRRCVESLQHIAHLAPEILVFDDASEVPVETALQPQPWLRILRDESAPGNIVGRNRLVREASADVVLLLDDDAALLDGTAVERAMEVMFRGARVAAVAFAQADEKGSPWPEAMQPARGKSPRYIAAFIGFAHLLNRQIFLQVGGYRETFVFYGEEKDYCLRLLDRGFHVVYLPDALVIHAQDAGGRAPQRYLRYVTRNDCLNALYNEPIWRVLWLVPARLALYFRMRSQWRITDPGGLGWVLGEIAANTGAALKARKPVSRRTRAAWRHLRDRQVPYDGPLEQQA